MYIDSGLSYEIVKFLKLHELLITRLVFREHIGARISDIYKSRDYCIDNLIYLVKIGITKKRVVKVAKKTKELALLKPKWAQKYAESVLYGRWIEGESIIMKNNTAICRYLNCFGCREMEKYEYIFMKDPQVAYAYVDNVLKRAWPAGELAISKIPTACVYATRYLTDRSKLMEQSILRNVGCICKYIQHIKCVWPEAEQAIVNSNDAYLALLYVKITKTRFMLAEPHILNCVDYAQEYLKIAFPHDYSIGEDNICRNIHDTFKYIRDVIRERWIPGEYMISLSSNYSLWYATQILNGPFRAGEKALRSNKKLWKKYMDRIFDDSDGYHSE
jgi:hypothetical protein